MKGGVCVDKFEYGCVYLNFKRNEDGLSFSCTIETLLFTGVDSPVINRLPLDETFRVAKHTEIVHHSEESDSVVTRYTPVVERNYSLQLLTSAMSTLGKNGWDVIEYKTNNDPAFGQAMIKRKISDK